MKMREMFGVLIAIEVIVLVIGMMMPGGGGRRIILQRVPPGRMVAF